MQFESIQPSELVFFERLELPERKYDSEAKKWIKTGEKTEMWQYTFVDQIGDKIVMISKEDYKEFKGEMVNLRVKISYDDYGRKIKVALDGLAKA